MKVNGKDDILYIMEKQMFETTNQKKPIVPIDSGRFSRFVGLKATAIWKWANRKVLKVLSFQEVWKNLLRLC